ncbi:MAG: helix-turn-helix domain-containing protein [Hyphomicrobium sp.]
MDTLKNTAHLNQPHEIKISPLSDDCQTGLNSDPKMEKGVLSIHAHDKLEKITRLLSDRNLKLLSMIGTQKPKTLAELSRISGRPKASLTRTLARLSQLGVIVLSKSKGRGKTPTLTCDQLRLNIQFHSS